MANEQKSLITAGYKLYKYERFKELLEDNKNLNKLFVPTSYKLENFQRGTNYINLEMLYPQWIKKDKDVEEKKTRKRLSEQEKKVRETKSYKIRKKLKENIPIKLRLDYRQFKETAFPEILNEWKEMSSPEKEEYEKRATTLIRRKQTKINNNVKRWNSFKESVENVINDQNDVKQTIRTLNSEIKNLDATKNKKEIKNKKKLLGTNRERYWALHSKLMQYKKQFMGEFVDSFTTFSNVPATQILDLAKVLNMEAVESKDEKTKEKLEDEYKETQKIIQQTLSEQQDLINKSKTRLSNLLQKIREEYDNVQLSSDKNARRDFVRENREKMESENKNKSPEEIKNIVRQRWTRLSQKNSSNYNKLLREKEELLKQISAQLKAIERKNGLDKLKKNFDRKVQTYLEKESETESIIKKVNENKLILNESKDKLKNIKIQKSRLKKNPKYYEMNEYDVQRLESLKQIENFLKTKIRQLEKQIMIDEEQDSYRFYEFKKNSDTFKSIKKIKILYNVYEKQIDVLRSIIKTKPSYIEFKKQAFILKRPTLGQIPRISVKSLRQLYTKLYQSKNVFINNLTGYLPDDSKTIPILCKKVLVKIGANILLNNNTTPHKFTNAECAFLYIDENKTKIVKGKTYYQIIDKNLKFIEKNGVLNQCSIECPKKTCDDYMPSSTKKFKCSGGECISENSNNQDKSYIDLVKKYRQDILTLFADIFKKKLRFDYPEYLIYASNVEKYYYINSVNFLSYIFNCCMFLSLLSVKFHPSCRNYIVENIIHILQKNDYKNLPLNFKAILKFICSEDFYTENKEVNEKRLTGFLLLKEFKKCLNFQLNNVYSSYAITSKRKKFVEVPTDVTERTYWQDTLITPSYVPIDSSKLTSYKSFLKNLHTLIQSDIKKLTQAVKLAKTSIKKDIARGKLGLFNNDFIGNLSSLQENIIHTVSTSDFNPYFYNLLQLTISNFLIYYSTISNSRNVKVLFVNLEHSLRNTLTQTPYHKTQMNKIKQNVQERLSKDKFNNNMPPQTISNVVMVDDKSKPKKVESVILWSNRANSCNPLLAQLDSLIRQDQFKTNPKKEPSIPETKKEIIPETKEVSLELKEGIPEIKEVVPETKEEVPETKEEVPETKEEVPETKKASFNFKTGEKCFQCKKEIENTKLRTVHLPNNKVICFCGFKCFTKYDH